MCERRIGPYDCCSVVQGDWLEVLRQLPDESVHCVVTSPPYWGLRDYGTASWEGGDPDCLHSVGGQVQDNKAPGAIMTGQRPGVDASQCRKCSAVRIDAQLGLERTPEEYVAKIVEGFREVRRVLRSDGTCWVNLGDSYASAPAGNRDETFSAKQASNAGSEMRRTKSTITGGLKPKDLCGIPWRVALALQADGWWLRQDIIWSKPNPMPESVTDRCTKAHEYIFLLTKSERYFYDAEAIKEEVTGNAHARGDGVNPKCAEPGSGIKQNSSFSGAINELVSSRNKRSVWEITSKPFPEAHFATFPPEIPETCIKAGTSEHGCCRECGAPWERMVEKSGGTIGKSWHNHEDDLGRGQQSGDSGKLFSTYKVETLGWRPTCICNAGEPIGCTVLDPFSGAGTVRMVAMKLGRHFIGAELNPEYIKLGYERTWVEDAQPSLFEPQPEQLQLS